MPQTYDHGDANDSVPTLMDAPSSATPVGGIVFYDGAAYRYVSAAYPLPVTFTSIPLPAGAATAALQTSGNTLLTAIGTLLAGTLAVGGTVAVSNFPAMQPVSLASCPLPTGAATEATLAAVNAKVTACNTGAVTISVALPAGTNVIGHVILDASSAVIGHVVVDSGAVVVTNAGTFAVQAACAGDTAAGATDAGNPVKVGGYASSAVPTAVTAGQRVNGWFGLNGQAAATPLSVNGAGDSGSCNVPFDLIGNARSMSVGLMVFNSSTWDRQRGNHEVTALASAARTTATNSSDLTNYNSRGVVVVVDVTAGGGGGAGGITVTIKGKDTLSGKYSTVLASAVITTTGTTKLIVYPGLTASANAKADEPLPRLWRVEVTVADATSYTYSVGANYIL